LRFRTTGDADKVIDLNIKHFLLLRLHRVYELGVKWKADTIGLLAVDSGPDWDTVMLPPPLPRSCTRVGPLAETDVQNTWDELSDGASSDDGEGGEVEEAPAEVDATIFGALDRMEISPSDFHDDV
jgi:hypothetical protein